MIDVNERTRLEGQRLRLKDKVALVTGGGTGIGKAAALRFAAEGARVVLVGRREGEIAAVANAIEAAGGNALAIPADVSRAPDVQAILEGTMKRFGRLDCAFNNAGVDADWAPVHETDEAEFDRVVGINLKGAWLCIKYELEAILRADGGGAIVNTSSWLAAGALPTTAVYAASKGGLDAMIRAIALEVGPRGIRINNVRPGIIDTPMFRRWSDDEAAKPFAAHTPLKRLGLPEDIGDVVVWLCTDEARFVTGQSILVDGGFAIAGIR